MKSALADAVLPLIRTRADLYRYSVANRHGMEMHEAVDLLELAIPDTDPVEVYSVAHRALTSAIKVIARADDSSGIIGDACRRLLALHPGLAKAASVPAGRLVTWMLKFQFEGDVDYFELDPVAYAPALGERGLASYRSRLDQVRESLRPAPTESFARDPDRHERWVLEWNDRRLAVLDRDVEAIIRTHLRDRKVAAWFQHTAEALEEIGRSDLAIEWARKAMDVGPRHQSLKAADYWCSLLAKNHPGEELAARLFVFRRWPSSATASALHSVVESEWDAYHGEVMDALAPFPADAVSFALLTLEDASLAWNLARSLELDDDHVWAGLIKSYERVDPVATLPIHRRLVEAELTEADARSYRRAARRLARMRELVAGGASAAEVDDLIATLRETHRRRPRLQREFDRLGLP